jgi:hypothetical protein
MARFIMLFLIFPKPPSVLGGSRNKKLHAPARSFERDRGAGLIVDFSPLTGLPVSWLNASRKCEPCDKAGQRKKNYEKEGMREIRRATRISGGTASTPPLPLPLFGNPAISYFETLGFASPPHGGFAISELFGHKSRALPVTSQPYSY